jgi:hydrogenase nickel incorporation protein HypA/HybF
MSSDLRENLTIASERVRLRCHVPPGAGLAAADAFMHEMSIAMALVDLAGEEKARLGEVRIDALRVRLGPLAGVVREALSLSFEVATAGTELDGARLDIEETPIVAFCASCGVERVIASAQHLHCPACGTPTPDIRGGRELQLTAMEITEHAPAHR